MKVFFYTLAIVALISCAGDEHKFDGAKWAADPQQNLHHRENMIKDLMENHLAEGMPYSQVIQQLGEPDSKATFKEQFTLSYDVSKTENSNQEPARIKSLIITFGSDSLVNGFNVEELKFKQP